MNLGDLCFMLFRECLYYLLDNFDWVYVGVLIKNIY